MAHMASERQALLVATEFVKYKNAVDEALYGVDSPRPRFVIDPSNEPKKIGTSIIFMAVPKIPIESDDPKNEHHFDRRRLVIVKVYRDLHESLNVPLLEAAWFGKIPDEQLNELSSDCSLWTGLYAATNKDPRPKGTLG
jgi:hypothetical protein